jgi:DNA-binding transcriptional ArsR family regulator
VSRPPDPPSKAETVADLLASAQRRELPLRHSFLQRSDADGRPAPGALAALVRRGVASTLEQYLLLHARAVGRTDEETKRERHDVYLESRVWGRALGLHADESGLRTVQRNWKVLSDLRLVDLDRSDRHVRVTLLDEDGSGAPYRHPGRKRDGRYLRLPYAYWLDGYADKLRVPGKAMLLVAMQLPDWFSLPFSKGPEWYGIGSSTVERGLRELTQAGFIEVHRSWRKAPLTAQGWTQDWRYRLRSPFGPSGKIAKSAPAELQDLLEPEATSPPLQVDSADGTPTRRKPATKKVVKRRAPSSRRKSGKPAR